MALTNLRCRDLQKIARDKRAKRLTNGAGAFFRLWQFWANNIHVVSVTTSLINTNSLARCLLVFNPLKSISPARPIWS